ncbi:unnamed protein product, partial [Urochloa humidicola]
CSDIRAWRSRRLLSARGERNCRRRAIEPNSRREAQVWLAGGLARKGRGAVDGHGACAASAPRGGRGPIGGGLSDPAWRSEARRSRQAAGKGGQPGAAAQPGGSAHNLLPACNAPGYIFLF